MTQTPFLFIAAIQPSLSRSFTQSGLASKIPASRPVIFDGGEALLILNMKMILAAYSELEVTEPMNKSGHEMEPGSIRPFKAGAVLRKN
ncbi:hypothetical protein RY831_26295 [Noviherbaspirillum sp. CPCC 100848]|uniref:Uncharacterized protein n=1 Tax=Noviherbaspirillum album TaxID=3080276 RepID=A0ABU6JHL2_9BURK|nr:hypothetical protein [Noviherbaspirillum sp. CPCC 100848]MEC4722682.1 hypothetical protein [Noviherbaspirillum sp. CPCC 100848]